MKYIEAKNKIKDFLKSFFDENWGDLYEIRDEDNALFLATHTGPLDQLQDILMVSKQEEGWFEAKNLTGFEKKLADIFMELALTPLEDREEEKKYVVKILNLADSSSILVKDPVNGIFNIMTADDVGPRDQVAFTKKEIDRLKDTPMLNIDWDKAVEEYDGEI